MTVESDNLTVISFMLIINQLTNHSEKNNG